MDWIMHTVACPVQSPWRRRQIIKKNILFYPYDEARYGAVVEACALKPDLDVFGDGGATEIDARSVISRLFHASILPADIGASLVDELACLAASLLRRLGMGPLSSHICRTWLAISQRSTLQLPKCQGTPAPLYQRICRGGHHSAFIGVLSAIMQYTGALRASSVLFMRPLVSVVQATMRWHDIMSQGILYMIYRFSKVKKLTNYKFAAQK